jgi:hypothetical protein
VCGSEPILTGDLAACIAQVAYAANDAHSLVRIAESLLEGKPDLLEVALQSDLNGGPMGCSLFVLAAE